MPGKSLKAWRGYKAVRRARPSGHARRATVCSGQCLSGGDVPMFDSAPVPALHPLVRAWARALTSAVSLAASAARP